MNLTTSATDRDALTAGGPLAVDSREAARLLRCCPKTISTLIASGELASMKIGRLRRIPIAAIERFLADRLAAESSAR